MNTMSPIKDAELIPRGCYRVGSSMFRDKISALAHSAATNQPVRWDFNDELFGVFDWTQEPQQDISYFYTKRCQQIRDEYQYIVLHYSGGSDSNNILQHFYRAGIHIDQINVTVPLEYYERHTSVTGSVEAGDLHNEWYLVIKPDLEWVKKHMPNTKISIFDFTKDMIEFDVDQDWILHAGEHCNPNVVSRMKYYDVVDSKIYDSKKVGHIYGVDKPRVFQHQGQWYFAFLDSILGIISSYKPVWLKHDHVNVVNFYWSPDLVPLLIKQAHLLKRYYESSPQFMSLASFRALDPWEFELQQNIIKTAVYPYWRKDIFQVKKGTKTFFKEFDQWFFDLASTTAKNRWQEGFRYLLQQVPLEWINKDINNMPTGVRGMWSKWHNLGPVLAQ
jgi:hypothetical protein